MASRNGGTSHVESHMNFRVFCCQITYKIRQDQLRAEPVPLMGGGVRFLRCIPCHVNIDIGFTEENATSEGRNSSDPSIKWKDYRVVNGANTLDWKKILAILPRLRFFAFRANTSLSLPDGHSRAQDLQRKREMEGGPHFLRNFGVTATRKTS